MPATFTIPNFSQTNIKGSTKLSAITLAGATSLPVQNSAGFANGNFIVTGALGAEGAELNTVNAVVTSTTALPIAAASFKHSQYEAVSLLFGNQIKIYRAPNVDGSVPADTNFTLLTVTPLTIAPDSNQTSYTDPAGSNGYWYKFTYYNSASTAETALSDAVASRGNVAHYAGLDDIRNEAGFAKSPYVTDNLISLKRDAAEAEVNGALTGIYSLPLTAPINPFIADITTRLAAGLLMSEQYGMYSGASNDTNGVNKLAAARADLLRIQNKSLELTDTAGNDTAITGTGFAAWPNSSTASAQPTDGGGYRNFRISDVQGYESRQY